MGGRSVDLRTGYIQRVTEGVASNSDEACSSGRRVLNAKCEPPNSDSQRTQVRRHRTGRFRGPQVLGVGSLKPSWTRYLSRSLLTLHQPHCCGLPVNVYMDFWWWYYLVPPVHKIATLAGSTLMAGPTVNLHREHWG